VKPSQLIIILDVRFERTKIKTFFSKNQHHKNIIIIKTYQKREESDSEFRE